MKVSCLRVSTDILIGRKHDIVTNFLAKKFLGIGVVLQNSITTQNNPENIFNALKFLDSDIVFVIGENTSSKNYAIKKVIANHLNLKLEKNEICKNNVENYFKQENTPVLIESENEFYAPENSIILHSKHSYLQGFAITSDKTFIFLPDDINFVEEVFEHTLKELLISNALVQYKTHIIKTFGIYERDIYSILNDLIKNIHKILIITYPTDLEVTILIRYNEKLDPEIVRSYISKIYERLNKYIYADEDVTLSQRVIDLLKVGNKSIAIAEGVSGGTIASTFFKNSKDANKFIKSAIVCPNSQSKIDLLKLNKKVIDTFGEISVETAYEMAASLLEVSKADYVICTTGISYTNNPNERKVTYIAVGNVDGIHVFKTLLLEILKLLLTTLLKQVCFI